MKIKIIKPGTFSTLQDLGRFRFRNRGVSLSGAMDAFSLRMANFLVGNNDDEAGIELTLTGPELLFEEGGYIALCGRGMQAFAGSIPVETGKAIEIGKGTVLSFKPMPGGIRMYLAAAGGFSIDPVLGSKSTLMRAACGGFEGRMLKAGDILFGNNPPHPLPGNPDLSGIKNVFPDYENRFRLRILKGPEAGWLDVESYRNFLIKEFRVSPQSDRMGYRMEGEPLKQMNKEQLLSTAVTPGTLQVLPDGNIILLMSDCQTTGGYPRIGFVAGIDLPLAAQLRPGDTVRFEEISLEVAERIFLERESEFRKLKSKNKSHA